MDRNENIAKVFDMMAKEYKKDRYRKRAYENAAAAIRRFDKPIISGKQAKKDIPGVGESVAAKIDEILRSGTLEILEKRTEEEKSKSEVLQLFETIQGVGPATAEKWYNAGYRTLEDLKKIFPTFTIAQKIGYKYYNDLQKRIPREEIAELETILHNLLGDIFTITGSYRRGESTSSDIDVVVKDGITMKDIVDMIQSIIIDVITEGTDLFMGVIKYNNHPVRRMDIRLANKEEWPYTMLYFTGDLRLNTEMRTIAHKLGMKLTNKSLIDKKGDDVPAKSEKDIFDHLSLQYLSPEERKGNFQLVPKLNKNERAQVVKEIVKEEKIKEEKLKEEKVKGEKEEREVLDISKSQWLRPTKDLFIYVGEGIKNTGDIAAFDLDGTIVRPAVGQFSRNVEDVFLMPRRYEKMKELIDKGYLIVIFTNQKSPTDNKRLFHYHKVINAIKKINLPIMLFMSTGDDQFRKPNIGMWEAMKQMVTVNSAFFVGDSAGRYGDHSDSDKRFAENIGIKFFTPEEFFGI